MIIKVCGMREATNIRNVEDAGANWIGFNFYESSKRFVGYEPPEYLPDCIRVGVFVNAPFQEIMIRVSQYNLNVVQLHGNETPQICQKLRRMGLQVIKVFNVGEEIPSDILLEYESVCDYFLLDTQCRDYGGSGKQFDWNLISNYKSKVPFLLAGGINPNSIEALCTLRHPMFAGIDINSGFEIRPGLKDHNKIHEFIKNIKSKIP